MAAVLEIRDGQPNWWNSPDIWVVPGNDPNGAPGQPIAGQPAYLWGRARNTGDQPVSGARVDFYWSNPATGVLRSNSNLVGSAFVDLNPDESKEVLCIIPWIPEIVNDGHECVVAEIIHPADPLPSPPPDVFSPPTYRQIAQKNLNVLVMRSMMVMAIQVATPKRIANTFSIRIDVGGRLDDENVRQLGLEKFKPSKHEKIRAGLTLEPGCDDSGKGSLEREIKLNLDPGTAKPVYLRIWPPKLEPRTYLLLHVISRDETGVTGGVSYALVEPKEA